MDTLTDDTEGCYYNRTVKFFYEESRKNISAHWRNRDYVIVTLGMTVCFIVIFSNLLVIGAILKNRRFHFPIYYLLGNLALADLFSGKLRLSLCSHCDLLLLYKLHHIRFYAAAAQSRCRKSQRERVGMMCNIRPHFQE